MSIATEFEPRLRTVSLPSDRSGEVLRVHELSAVPGVQFWSVSGSQRHWAKVHDTFTSCLVLGPQPMRAKWRYRGEERIVEGGDIQAMEPSELHRTTAVSEPADFFVVFWTPALLQAAAEELGCRAPHLSVAQTRFPPLSEALNALYRSLSLNVDPSAAEHYYLETTRQLLNGCSEAPPLAAEARYHPAVRRARLYIEAHFNETLSLDTLADQVGLSKFHLARTFGASVGAPPHQFQMQLRLVEARRRIEAGESIKQAAAMAGFADEAHLTRVFRRWIGVAPGTWRRLVRRPPTFSFSER